MQDVSTKYNAMCVHLSIKATSLSGVSGIGMRHTIQMPMTKVKVTGYVRKKMGDLLFHLLSTMYGAKLQYFVHDKKQLWSENHLLVLMRCYLCCGSPPMS